MRSGTSEDQSQSYDASSDYQRSAGVGGLHTAATLRPKRMEISEGDEGGTTQAPLISALAGAQTTKAQNRPSFRFSMDDSNDNESSQEAITPLDREQMKKEITQSLSAVEAKK